MRCPSCCVETFLVVDGNIVCEYCGANDIQDLLYEDSAKADKKYADRCVSKLAALKVNTTQ